MRKIALALIALFVFFGSLAATLGTIQLRDYETRGYVDATRDARLPYAVPKPGVNVDLRQYGASALRHNLSLIRESGFVWLRQFAYWDAIEAKAGQFDWHEWDAIAAALREYPELEPVVVLMNSPLWARVTALGESPTASAPPASLEDFAAFAAVFAARYGDVIDHYQIWDEPNLDDAWGLLPPSPAEYVALLGSAGEAIRAADPGAKVVAAALAPTMEINRDNISDLRYLERMYQHGAAELMDVVAAKPYGFSFSPLDRRVNENQLNFSRVIALREIMLRHGDGKKPIWASAWGWNALPDDWDGAESIWGSVSEDEQIRHTLSAFDRAHREWSWMGAMFLHHWQPDADQNSAQWGFSLLDADGAPKPLLEAIAQYPFPTEAQNGIFHPRTLYARYSGVWQFSSRGADIGWLETSDSQLEFDFYGSDIAMLLREDDYVAFLYPTIDGEAANFTPKDADGNAYVFLRSESRAPELNLAPISRGLTLESHTLRAVADRGWDRWAIAGYAVSSGDLREAFDRQIALGAMVVALSLPLCLISLAALPWLRWLPAMALAIRGLSAGMHLALSGTASLALMLALALTWVSPRPALIARDDVNILLALITGGLLYVSPGLLVTLIAGIVLFALVFHRLETGLALTLFWAPFFLSSVELYRFALPMVEVMILITALAAGLRFMAWLGRQFQSANSGFAFDLPAMIARLTLIDMGVVALAAAATLSLLWTRQIDVALTEWRRLVFEPLLFYVIFRACQPNRQALLQIAYMLLLAGVLASLIGLWGYFATDAVIVAEGGARRLVSVYGSPNNVALLLDRTLPLALAFCLLADSRRHRLIWLAALLVMAFALLLTQSVGGLLLGAPMAAAFVLFGCFGRRALRPVGMLIAFAAIGFAALTQISARFANILDFSRGTNFLRLRLWESAADMIRDYPLTGLGLDQFLYRYSGEYARPDAIWDLNLSHPHNMALDFWLRLGIAGPVILLLLQIGFWREAMKALRRTRSRDSMAFALTAGLMGGMAGTLAHGLIDNSYFVVDMAFIFMFHLAAIGSLVGVKLAEAGVSSAR